ncbi:MULTISPECIES: pirin family protein [unclassified Pseudomonas]|jgi:redox-sensitive bicupin YhaK (pirin superfamily)|uniref:pirin family protein n=1 Tax=unclassified Pseudomonas TaxID=196821 RepID=UPI002A36AD1B|nr:MULTISPECIES: pirin family protein [unclassified Pseudomonas]MDX9674205.1 pirin family protein [Pseudomonas sp. P8_250]WPN37276.1 pirin family protein [Pseudomonas sp. P8_139]WPN40922.1 pirin family protein [Pseudomonas sp. P8_229]
MIPAQSLHTAAPPDTAHDSVSHRAISYRTTGSGHGAIVRLMSPGDLGHRVKPFVFLDLFEGESSFINGMPMHPHSGIATITLITEGNLRFEDAGSGKGMIDYGGVEWMRAGGGVWHGKEMSVGTSKRIQGFQLWIALPPELENASVDSQYLESSAMPEAGPARVILGSYQGVQSPVRAPAGMNYLLVTLRAGESWRYVPPRGHESLWLSVSRGALCAPNVVMAGEMVVFEPGSQAVTLQAMQQDAVFVIGSAQPHPYELALGNYSVHTNRQALRAGEANIAEIGARLREYLKQPQQSTSVPVFK